MRSRDEAKDIWIHLGELRRRLLVSLVALIAAALLSLYFSPTLAEVLAQPIGGTSVLVAIEVTENISVMMNIALLSGFTLALPVILFQLVSFLLPGLMPREQKWLLASIPLLTLFFIGGVLFAYFVMLPAALPFLMGLLGIRTQPRPGPYFEFVLTLLAGVGLVFETPLLVLVLARLRLVSAGMLAKQWRIALVAIAVLAAVITPTGDPLNMGLLMLPLTGLYLISILFAALARPKGG